MPGPIKHVSISADFCVQTSFAFDDGGRDYVWIFADGAAQGVEVNKNELLRHWIMSRVSRKKIRVFLEGNTCIVIGIGLLPGMQAEGAQRLAGVG